MSVRQGDRSQGKLQVLNLARSLCVYTLTICKNEKVFPKSQRWLLTAKITNEAVDALTCIRRANAVRVSDGVNREIEYNYRYEQQIAAHSHLDALLSLIDIAYGVNSIESSRVEFWTQLVVNTDNLLKAWIRSDKERFSIETK